MTGDEKSALRHLGMAKQSVKDAFTMLDPAPRPIGMALLKALDAIDAAIKKIKARG